MTGISDMDYEDWCVAVNQIKRRIKGIKKDNALLEEAGVTVNNEELKFQLLMLKIHIENAPRDPLSEDQMNG